MARPDDYRFANLERHVGHDFGVSAPIRLPQARIDQFAEATGDHQWIHVDVARARAQSPFGGPVAHGFLTLALVASAMDELGIVPDDATAAFNYGVEKVRFLAPVLAGSQIRVRCVLQAVEARGEARMLLRITGKVEIENSEKPALIGEFLALVQG